MNAEKQKYIAHQRKIDGALQNLEDHLFGVSKIGLKIHGEIIGLLHDLGKYSKEFQNYIQSAVGLLNPDEDDFVNAKGLKGKVDHSTAGAQFVWQQLAKHGQLSKIAGQILAMCIASHHSGLIDCLSSDAKNPAKDKFTNRMNKQDERVHIKEAALNMDTSVNGRFQQLVRDPKLIDNLKETIKRIHLCDNRNHSLIMVTPKNFHFRRPVFTDGAWIETTKHGERHPGPQSFKRTTRVNENRFY